MLEDIKREITKDTQIYLATDDDREGESISWHLIEALNLHNYKIKRIIFHEITPEAIHNALKTPKQINQNIVDAQQARRIIDRLIGFKLSPCLWQHIQSQEKGLSAGRVQSALLNLLEEREKYIENSANVLVHLNLPDILQDILRKRVGQYRSKIASFKSRINKLQKETEAARPRPSTSSSEEEGKTSCHAHRSPSAGFGG